MGVIPKIEQGKLRKRILDDAAELIAAQGFEGLTINAVSDLGGVSVSNIRYYFRNQRALLFELADAWLMRLLNSLDVPEHVPSDEQVLRLCRSYALAIDTDPLRHLTQLPLGRLSPRHRSVVQWITFFTPSLARQLPSAAQAVMGWRKEAR